MALRVWVWRTQRTFDSKNGFRDSIKQIFIVSFVSQSDPGHEQSFNDHANPLKLIRLKAV